MTSPRAEPIDVHPPSKSRVLKLDDFEAWRQRGIALMVIGPTLIAAYWILWFTDRHVVASSHGASYVAFEQAFPLADAWLAATAVLAAIQLWRRRRSALLWAGALGGAGIYLCAMDALYDVQHGIYTAGHGGTLEAAVQVSVGAWVVGAMIVGWHFRHDLREAHDDLP